MELQTSRGCVLRCFSEGLKGVSRDRQNVAYMSVIVHYIRGSIIHRYRACRHPTCLKTITLNFWIVQNE